MGMGIERLEPREVAVETVETLGLAVSELELMSPEGLAASLRRAASFLCPATPGSLRRAVAEALAGLPGFDDESPGDMDELIHSLIAYGDLLELPHEDDAGKRRLLFLGSPGYVRRRGTNTCLLVGIRPEGAPLISGELLETIVYEGHVRLIRSTDSRPVNELLDAEGLAELLPAQWLRAPREASAEDVLAFYVDRLDAAGSPGDVELRVIDPAARVTYYKGRWRPLQNRDAGRFVARRPQAFGADLWCFAEVSSGAVTKLIDLPLQSNHAPAADEAWRLQAAIDALAKQPQRVRVRDAADATMAVLDLFSPLPSWTQRRLDVVGTPLPGAGGALFSYRLLETEVEEELRFLGDMMWLAVERANSG